MKAKDCLFRLRELRGKISGGDEKFDEERIAAMLFAENAIVSVPINCENIYFDEYGFAHDKKLEKPFTNADRIRAMTDEELAKWVRRYGDCLLTHCCACDICVPTMEDMSCEDWILKWLKMESEDGNSR